MRLIFYGYKKVGTYAICTFKPGAGTGETATISINRSGVMRNMFWILLPFK